VGVLAPAAVAGAGGTTTTTAGTASTAPDAAQALRDDADHITSLEKTVGGWKESCATTGDLDQDLEYANGALAQGDPAGARLFLRMAENDARDGDAGYVAPDHDRALDSDATSVMDAVPTTTADPSATSGARGTPTLPGDPRCPSLDSYDLSKVEAAAAQVVRASTPQAKAGTVAAVRGAAVARLTAQTSSIPSATGSAGPTAELTDDASSEPADCQEPGVDETANTLRKIGLAIVDTAASAAESGTEVPGIGTLVGAIAETLWPDSGPDLWAAMTKCVDEKINQAVDQVVQNGIDTTLMGMNAALKLYTTVLKNPRNADGTWPQQVQTNVLDQWRSTLTVLTNDLPTFQPSIRPYLYLPEYVEAMTLVLGMLRDGIQYGSSFGLDAATLAQTRTDMANDIATGTTYVNNQIAAYQAAVSTSTGSYSSTENYDAVAKLDQGLLPATVDQTFYWPYLNPVTYPNPVHPPNTRVTYTIAYGYADNNAPITLAGAPAGAGVDPLVHLEMWGGDRLDALSVTYGTNPPKRIGDQSGGSRAGTNGTGFTIGPGQQNGPVVEVSGYYDPHSIPIDLDFTFGPSPAFPNGTSTGMKGHQPPGTQHPDIHIQAQYFDAKFAGQVLDFAWIHGISSGYGTADCVVFGFRYADSFTPPVT
jgi:hypothetical protein